LKYFTSATVTAGVSTLAEQLIACSSAHVPHSTSSPNASKKDDDKQNGLDPETKQSATVKCTLPLCPYLATMDQFYTPFYRNTMKQDLFTHPLPLPLHRQQE